MSQNLLHTYSYKIKTVEEIQAMIGGFPRDQKVIMCHGVFDVIHPGHLRHLIYAKEKAPILIVSLTSDVHINKGKYRPHVPENLRAANMAAYELVTYVVIDRNQTPLENLRKLQPDFFCKGFEYSPDGKTNPKTQEEIDVLNGYGGRVIFTPGDYVYSSSKLIEQSPPDLKYEKLEMLLSLEELTFDDLREALKKIANKKVHVIGDTIVDSYTHCEMIGGQTKTPTMSVLFQEKIDYIGGAAMVAKHLRAAGAEVVFTTVLGDDQLKDFVLEGLKEDGVKCNATIDPLRPTVNKNAIVVKDYRLLKIDTLDNASISQGVLNKICNEIETTPSDAVIFADFRHGIFNKGTIPVLVDAIPKGVFRVADSQVASRWGNILEFTGFDLITPNEREARFSLGDQDSVVRPLGHKLYKESQCKLLILKMGPRGAIVFRDGNEDIRSFFTIDSFVDHLVDPVGAGDALLAYATLTFLATKNPVLASILGSIAASVECEKDGNIPVTPEDILQKINVLEKCIKYV